MPTLHEREAALLALALELPSARRPTFLDAVCDGDPGLRHRIEALLAERTHPDNSGDSAITATAAAGNPATKLEAANPQADEAVGQTIGRYKLLERLGEGGCGVVYVAEQSEPVRRRVALKVIKLGMDTKAVVARFEAERQALAMMDHQNIAKVLDAGTTDAGRPYFVMELVRGIRITDYCDQNNQTTKERLELFIPVCQAIQHAHQKGIIHRDIKPSNVLVTLHDGVPVPKVIDFGIAKATEGRLTDATVYTQLHQFIGTPAYMSPEQAEMSGLDVDTRSDIYSLGVVLYELLTGRTPFDPNELMSQGIDAMRKTIREKDPVRPSTKLATLNGEELTSTARRRNLDAPKLIHLLRGDLDWIVMKCLEKDRTRRYETANGLAFDLKRHLNNEPVLACPPTAVYRLQKSFRRHKLAFLAAAGVATALLLGIVGTTLGLLRARQSERLALRSRADAEKLSNFMLEDFYNELEPSGQFGTVARLARQALDYYESLPASLRTSETTRNRAIAQARLSWVTLQQGWEFQKGKALAEEATLLLEQRRREGDASEPTALALAVALKASGMYQEYRGSLGAAAIAHKRAVEVLQPLVRSGKASARVQVEYGNILNRLSACQTLEEGVATCNEALSVLAGLGALTCSNLDAASIWADTADSQARELLGLGRIDEAEQIERQGLKLAESVIQRQPNYLHALRDLVFAPDVLGLIEVRRNHDAAALEWFRKGSQAAENSFRFNTTDANSWVNVCLGDYSVSAMLLRAGRVAEAAEVLQEGETKPVPELRDVGRWSSLALLEAQRGNRSAAEKAMLEARKAREAFITATSMPLAGRQDWLEAVHDVDRQLKLALGEDAAVLAAAREDLLRMEQVGKAQDNPEIPPELNQFKRRALSDAARAALRLERFGEAETFAQALVAPPLRTGDSDRMLLLQPDDSGWGRVLLAQAQLGQGRREEAQKTLEPALAHYREMRAQGVVHLTFHQRFARALYVQALVQASVADGPSRYRDSLAEAAKLLNELSDEARQLHDSKELLSWIEEGRRKAGAVTQP